MATEDPVQKLKQEACEQLDRICDGREVWREGGHDYFDSLESNERAAGNYWYGQYLAADQLRRETPTGRSMTRSETMTILGALRLLQRQDTLPGGIHEILTDGEIPRLTPAQIDTLCETLNSGEVIVYG